MYFQPIWWFLFHHNPYLHISHLSNQNGKRLKLHYIFTLEKKNNIQYENMDFSVKPCRRYTYLVDVSCVNYCFTEQSFSEIHTVRVKSHDRTSNYWLRTSDSLICSSQTCLQPIRKINSLFSRRTTANSSTNIWRYMFLYMG